MQIKKKNEITRKEIIENFSLSRKLREQNKTNDLFEVMVGNLTLEELIALKLELSYRSIGFPMYGFNIFRITNNIVQDAVFKFALSVNPTKTRARMFLGLSKNEFGNYLHKYETEEYLLPKENKDNADN